MYMFHGKRQLLNSVLKLGRTESGSILPLTAVLLPVLVLIIAFSVETSIAFSDQNQMQAAADHAARYASILRSQDRDRDYVRTSARAIARANGFIHGTNANVDIRLGDEITPSLFSRYQSVVEVSINKSRSTFFPNILNRSEIGQKARAVAVWDMSPCVVALKQNSSGSAGSYGVSTNGNFIFTAGCGIYSNSQSTRDSMQVQSGQIWSNGFYIAGAGDYSSQTAVNLKTLDGTDPGLVTKGATVFILPQQYANLAINLDAGVPATDGNTIINPSSKCEPNSNNVSPPTGGAAGTTCTYTQTTTTTTTVPVYGTGNQKNTVIGTTTQTSTTTSQVTTSMFTATGLLRSDLYYGIISTSSTLTLDPGKRYYVNGINMNSSAAVIDGSQGNAILIVGSSPQFFMAGGSTLNINPLTYQQDTTYYGISLMSGMTNLTSADVTGGSGGTNCDPLAADYLACLNKGINGVIAFPNASMKLAGGSSTSKKCQTFYVGAIVINGSGGIGSGCNSTLVNMSAYRTRNLVE